jgi:polygalacturonase
MSWDYKKWLIAFTLAGCTLIHTVKGYGAMPVMEYNVRDFGAKGDGKTLDTDPVNRAIEAAAKAGGGTIHFPAGTYACHSIRLKSHISLYSSQGSVILVAPYNEGGKGYDEPEPNEWGTN